MVLSIRIVVPKPVPEASPNPYKATTIADGWACLCGGKSGRPLKPRCQTPVVPLVWQTAELVWGDWCHQSDPFSVNAAWISWGKSFHPFRSWWGHQESNLKWKSAEHHHWNALTNVQQKSPCSFQKYGEKGIDPLKCNHGSILPLSFDPTLNIYHNTIAGVKYDQPKRKAPRIVRGFFWMHPGTPNGWRD